MTELMPGTAGTEAVAGPRAMIVADDAHVAYRVYASGKRMTARDALFSANALRGGRGLQTVHALRGVSFTASEGETIGVIGHNGSGKSTLFRAMSGLIPTSEGKIWAADRPVLLGVNAALVPELSGENNIKLGLLAMGFTVEEAAARVDEIADFAELNEFLYHPMRTYSSGMGARLRFAIASAKAHSILLIDEALSVGDRRFKLKSEQRIRGLRDNAGLVMIVSHSIGSLRDTCGRVLWIHKGELRADGPTADVIADYVNWTKQPGNAAVGAASVAKTGRTAARSKTADAVAAAVTAEVAPTVLASVLPDAPTTPFAAKTPATSNVAEPKDVATRAAPEAALSPFEQLLADAAVDAREIVAPTEGVRTIARRDRYRRSARERQRRRMLTMVITGIVVVLAIGAGAAIAVLAAMPRVSDTPSHPSSAATAGSYTPIVSGFTADGASAVCEAEEGEATVQLSWHVSKATEIAVGAGAAEVDAIDNPVGSGLPGDMTDYAVPFPCAEENWSYTLTAEGADNSRASSVVTVVRELVVPTPTPTPTTPGTSTRPGQSTNPSTGSGGNTTTDPAAPVVTPDPVDPTTPVDPVDPVDPTEPTEPTDPVEPTTPVDPEPTTPVGDTTTP